MAGSAPE
jgi:hypothetical protein